MAEIDLLKSPVRVRSKSWTRTRGPVQFSGSDLKVRPNLVQIGPDRSTIECGQAP